MRRHVDRRKLELFMLRLGGRALTPGTVYLTGGSSFLLLGIREQTVDIDIKLDPEPEGAFEAIAELKESLGINVELASPDQFIPPLPGWQDRSPLIITADKIAFRHYDFYSQALSKIERGYDLDLSDARALIDQGLVLPTELRRLALAIRPQWMRYPAVDPVGFERSLDEFLADIPDDDSQP